MKSNRYVPKRGDIVWIELNPQAGHEQAGRRPAVVLSPRAYNEKTDLALLCPVTSRTKGYPFEVDIPEGLKVTGTILADRVKCLDWEVRNADFIESLPETVINEVLSKVRTLL